MIVDRGFAFRSTEAFSAIKQHLMDAEQSPDPGRRFCECIAAFAVVLDVLMVKPNISESRLTKLVEGQLSRGCHLYSQPSPS